MFNAYIESLDFVRGCDFGLRKGDAPVNVVISCMLYFGFHC